MTEKGRVIGDKLPHSTLVRGLSPENRAWIGAVTQDWPASVRISASPYLGLAAEAMKRTGTVAATAVSLGFLAAHELAKGTKKTVIDLIGAHRLEGSVVGATGGLTFDEVEDEAFCSGSTTLPQHCPEPSSRDIDSAFASSTMRFRGVDDSVL